MSPVQVQCTVLGEQNKPNIPNKPDGKEYEPDSLKDIQGSIEHNLK